MVESESKPGRAVHLHQTHHEVADHICVADDYCYLVLVVVFGSVAAVDVFSEAS